jgi:hypothetical protein
VRLGHGRDRPTGRTASSKNTVRAPMKASTRRIDRRSSAAISRTRAAPSASGRANATSPSDHRAGCELRRGHRRDRAEAAAFPRHDLVPVANELEVTGEAIGRWRGRGSSRELWSGLTRRAFGGACGRRRRVRSGDLQVITS